MLMAWYDKAKQLVDKVMQGPVEAAGGQEPVARMATGERRGFKPGMPLTDTEKDEAAQAHPEPSAQAGGAAQPAQAPQSAPKRRSLLEWIRAQAGMDQEQEAYQQPVEQTAWTQDSFQQSAQQPVFNQSGYQAQVETGYQQPYQGTGYQQPYQSQQGMGYQQAYQGTGYQQPYQPQQDTGYQQGYQGTGFQQQAYQPQQEAGYQQGDQGTGFQQQAYQPQQETGFQQGYQGTGFQQQYQPQQETGFQQGYQGTGFQQQYQPQQETGFQQGYQATGFQQGYQGTGFQQQSAYQTGYQQPVSQGFQTGYAQPQNATPQQERRSRRNRGNQQASSQPAGDNLVYFNQNRFVDENGTAYNMMIRLAQPTTTAKCYRLIEFMRAGEMVLVNLEKVQNAQECDRCLDLLFGAAYAMDCNYTRVAERCVYLITPRSVGIQAFKGLSDMSRKDIETHWPGSNAANEQPWEPQYERQAAGGWSTSYQAGSADFAPPAGGRSYRANPVRYF